MESRKQHECGEHARTGVRSHEAAGSAHGQRIRVAADSISSAAAMTREFSS